MKFNLKETTVLDRNGLSQLYGGRAVATSSVVCGCACAYANNGGSSSRDNGFANSADGKRSPEDYMMNHSLIIIDGQIWG